MDDRIDLDTAAQQIADRLQGWRSTGMTVGELTWGDEGQDWPRTFTTDRSAVAVPYSVGIRCTKAQQEGSLVLFKGGWADLEYWAGGDAAVVVEAPGWENWLSISSFAALLDRFFNLFV